MAVVMPGRKNSVGVVKRTDSYRDRKMQELEEKLAEIEKQNETLLEKVKSWEHATLIAYYWLMGCITLLMRVH